MSRDDSSSSWEPLGLEEPTLDDQRERFRQHLREHEAERERNHPRTTGKLGRYEIRGEIARGGSGAVLRAWDPEQQREVAIKMLLEPPRAGSKAWTRFQTELTALKRLQHPFIVRILDDGTENGNPYLVMELVEGESLADRIARRGPLPIQEAIALTVRLAEALEYTHSTGAVIHRDVKPGNVLLASEGVPRLTDFGLARDLVSTLGRATSSGVFLGTPGYWAPELAAGKREWVGPATDIYGLGATLYAMLTGEPPFSGDTLFQVVSATTQMDPVPPSELRPGIPDALEVVCLRCLAKSPRDRYASSAELGRALEETPESSRGTQLVYVLGGLLVFAVAVAAVWWTSLQRVDPTQASSGSPRGAQPPTPTPPWYLGLPAGSRPAHLPAGIQALPAPGEYLNEADGSILVFVPGGERRWSCHDARHSHGPGQEHSAAVSAFFIGKYEVSLDQFRQFAGAATDALERIEYVGETFIVPPDHPAQGVSYEDSAAYCANFALRLPTSSEWLYAAEREGAWPWGTGDPDSTRANFGRDGGAAGPTLDPRDGHAFSAAVDSYPRGESPFGCLNMYGNAAEWVAGPFVLAVDGAEVKRAAVRGGAWSVAPKLGWVVYSDVADRQPHVGFRVARDAED